MLGNTQYSPPKDKENNEKKRARNLGFEFSNNF
jgi:hypothetical protein